MTKSSTNEPTAANGRSSLGKYTLVMIASPPTRLFDAPIRLCEKSVQGTSPAKTNSG